MSIGIERIGETTRPGKAGLLKNFEKRYLDPIEQAIEAKDWNSFKTAYQKGIRGCNSCHAVAGFPYIKYELPSTPPDMPKTSPVR